MKISYDSEVDALYIEFHPLADGTAQTQLRDELIANYTPDGKLAGLGILEASKILGDMKGNIVFEVAPVLTVGLK